MYTISCRDAGRDCDCIIEGENGGRDSEKCSRACSERTWLQGTGHYDSWDEEQNNIIDT